MKTQTISIRQQVLKSAVSLCLLAMLSLLSSNVSAQSTERTVSGVVKTFAGPVEYAAIVLKGTTVSTYTDQNGTFTFPKQLKENDVLVISTMMYDDIEIKIEEDTSFIKPYLEGKEIVITGALRTTPSSKATID